MYTIYAVQHTPAEMLAKYPTPALYAEGKIYLFGESLMQVAGIEPEEIVTIDLELTNEELDTYVDYLLTVLSAAEVSLSKPHGKYLYATRFGNKEVLIGEEV